MYLSDIVAYFRDCYRADSRTLSISNIFSSNVENRLILDGHDELLNGHLNEHPIPSDYALEVEKNLALYKREKVFYCCAFSILGRQEEFKVRESKRCAPLFIYPAKINTRDDLHFVQVDFSKRIVNINFLNTLKKPDVDDLYEKLVDKISPKFEDLGVIGKIRRVLEASLQDFHAEDLLLYPQLQGEKSLKKALQPKHLNRLDGFKIVPSLTLGVFRRSSSTRGILSELTEMSESNDCSEPVRHLFDLSANSDAKPSGKQGYVPTVLSDSQKNVIKTVDKYHTSLVIGPPGTGKSYTIASLAIDFLSKGKSVLIASRTDQAVDVIHKKIEKDLGIEKVALRAGRSGYRKSLKTLLEGILYQPEAYFLRRADEIKAIEEEIEILSTEEKKDIDQFLILVEKELRWGKFVADYGENANFFKRLKLRYIAWKNRLVTPHWRVTQKVLEDSRRKVQLIKKLTQLAFKYRVDRALYRNREMFKAFYRSLSARNSSRQQEFFDKIDLKFLLETFPIWLVNMADIHDVFPLETEVFDLAIIDEATQCDIASSLPIFQRAKKVVVVGDPKQLRHVSFLSQSAQVGLLKKNNLSDLIDNPSFDYRHMSILDLVNERIESQDQVCFLNEHYRSTPELIRFSNDEFYQGKLRIMTNIPQEKAYQPLEIISTSGKRTKGVNELEAKEIIKTIREIVSEQNELDPPLAQTIGVLSPFRDQVDHLMDSLIRDLPLDVIQKHDIQCGTAYSFQGEERDIMLISLAIDDESHHSAVIHLNKPEVFNVSITRARSRQLLFKSFNTAKYYDTYLGKYLAQIRPPKTHLKKQQQVTRDQFFEEVRERIEKLQYPYWVNLEVAGIFIDLVFKNGENCYGINLIGYPGQFVDALKIPDYEILARAGVQVFPLPYTFWQFEKERCFNELLAFAI